VAARTEAITTYRLPGMISPFADHPRQSVRGDSFGSGSHNWAPYSRPGKKQIEAQD